MNESEHVAKRLVECLRRQGAKVNPGAAESEILDLERRWRVQIPRVLREYLAIANGMPPGWTDTTMIRFWPVQEIVPLSEGAPEVLADTESQYGQALLFADYCLWEHAYAIQSNAPQHVLLVGGAHPLDLQIQFEKFIDIYCREGLPIKLAPH